ncbi:DUF397 domain-containing protein [Nocardia sp. AB354]|uniref:DUF397 domain-containing protein n=1 Tax=Nocardia sp. AB354 TaxID=3413283 RepID=UPI003C29E1F0
MNGHLSTAQWYKSRRSHGKDTCVEVAHLAEGTVGVRDSKNPTGPALLFTPANGTPSPPAFRTASSSDRRSSTEFEQPLTEYGTGQPVTRSWIAFDH